MIGNVDAGETAGGTELADRIEQAVYDYVYDNFGPSEAESPSWGIRGLAEYTANALRDSGYRPKHEIVYET